MVRLLLRYRADPNAPDYQYETPLHCAARRGATAAMEVLIEHGAKVNWRDEYKFTALHSAAIAGQAEAMKLLLQHGASFEEREKCCHLSLLYACDAPHHGHWITRWERGMRGGLCPPPPEYYDKLPPPRSNRRYYARFVEAVRLLLEGGANPNIREKETRATPLHYAALHGDADIARLLIEHGAKLNRLDSDGQSPLAVADCCDHEDVAGVLRAHEAKSIGGFQKQAEKKEKACHF
jgi:ankyrin repeat domain-containing protein 17